MAKKQLWVVVEWDDDLEETPIVHNRASDTYEKAWVSATDMAKKYHAEAQSAAGDITMNEDDGRIEVEILSQYHHYSVQSIDCP